MTRDVAWVWGSKAKLLASVPGWFLSLAPASAPMYAPVHLLKVTLNSRSKELKKGFTQPPTKVEMPSGAALIPLWSSSLTRQVLAKGGSGSCPCASEGKGRRLGGSEDPVLLPRGVRQKS